MNYDGRKSLGKGPAREDELIGEILERAAAVPIRAGLTVAGLMAVAVAVPVAVHPVSLPVMCGDLNDGSGARSASSLKLGESR